MKPTFTILILLLGFLHAQSQQPVKDGTHRNYKVVMERNAEYPGGNEALYGELFQVLEYPEEAKKNHIEGDLMVSFFVEADSSVTDVTALGDLGHGTAQSAKDAIRGLKFAPALQAGKAVRQQMMIPVLFRIYD